MSFLKESGIKGRVTGADGGYQIGEEDYIPDVAFMSAQRQPERPDAAYNPLPPDLVVEVISPTDRDTHLRWKVANYLHAGTTVWVIDPEAKQVEQYVPGAQPGIFGMDDTIDGGDVLPGLSLPVKMISDL